MFFFNSLFLKYVIDVELKKNSTIFSCDNNNNTSHFKNIFISSPRLIFEKNSKPVPLVLTDGSLILLPFSFLQKGVNTRYKTVRYSVSYQDCSIYNVYQ